MARTAVEDEGLADAASGIWTGVVEGLPRAGVALLVVLVAVGVGRVLRPLLCRRLARHRTPSFARVFARLASTALSVTGVVLAITITFPSVRPVDVLAGAGVLTIAIGIAFQQILGNSLAGVLLLFRQPFRGGDQVTIAGESGTVEEITIRETVLRTYDGRRVLVPNATVYSEVIQVQTADPLRRAAIEVGVAYETDLDQACRVAAEAVARVEGVATDPAPECQVVALGASTVDLEVLVWCDSRQAGWRRTASAARAAVKAAFDDAGIEMPADVVALQATSSYATALAGGPVTPGGAVARAPMPPPGPPAGEAG